MNRKPSSLQSSLTRKAKRWRQRISRRFTHGYTGGTSEGNSIQLYFDGDTAFDAMLDAIREAKHFIHLEMYIFFSDHIGKIFAEALSNKARQGITVRVLYDSIGSLEADKMQWAHMRDAGVTVVEFRPVAPWRKRSGIFGRNHRKNLVIDGTTAFTGGMNIADMWSIRISDDSAWRDTHCRVIGPAATHLNEVFLTSWEYASHEKIHPPDNEPPVTPDGSRCLVLGSQGLGGRKEIRKLFSFYLASARSTVHMTMPYFVPPKRLRKALYKAVQRGVEITILVPKDSDVSIVDYLREGLYPKMLNKGINIIEYLGPTLHAKTMVVDDRVAVMGSSNFDILSVALNSEVALVAQDLLTIAELNQQWHNDLMLSQKVGTQWKLKRPWWRLLAAKIGCFLIRRL